MKFGWLVLQLSNPPFHSVLYMPGYLQEICSTCKHITPSNPRKLIKLSNNWSMLTSLYWEIHKPTKNVPKSWLQSSVKENSPTLQYTILFNMCTTGEKILFPRSNVNFFGRKRQKYFVNWTVEKHISLESEQCGEDLLLLGACSI